jgi:hypothetical protein
VHYNFNLNRSGLGLLFLAANVSLGDAVVGGCSVADLRSALAQGGTVTFAQDCAITFASPITVTNQVRLEANGHSVTYGGGQFPAFIVEPGADLSLAGLTLLPLKPPGAGLYIKAGGAVTASNCVFSTLQAAEPGGGRPGCAGSTGIGESGGGAGLAARLWARAIFNSGVFRAARSAFLPIRRRGSGAGGRWGRGAVCWRRRRRGRRRGGRGRRSHL